jgi:hypothetical protein
MESRGVPAPLSRSGGCGRAACSADVNRVDEVEGFQEASPGSEFVIEATGGTGGGEAGRRW